MHQRLDGHLRLHSTCNHALLPGYKAHHLPALPQVGGAALGGCTVQGRNRADGTVQELALSSITHMPSLQQLVAAALPLGTQPFQLRRLGIFCSRLPLPALQGCHFLGHLTSLVLMAWGSPGGRSGLVLESLLQQAPRLQSLALVGFQDEPPFPPALVSRTGLRHLCLRLCHLSELPPGPYLNSELPRGTVWLAVWFCSASCQTGSRARLLLQWLR